MTASPDTGTGRDPRAHVAAGRQHTTTTTNRGDLMSTTPTAGVTLNAAAALQDPTQQTFNREQVAYLMHLAYDAGRTATYLDDIAELHAGWVRNRDPRPTAEQRIAQRIAAMETAGGDYPGGGLGVDWETGRPVRHLEVAA